MCLYEELFFDITLEGQKSELRKFVKFLHSGELSDFIDSADDYIVYEDDYDDKDDSEQTSVIFTNDDIGLEIDRFNPEDFLDIFCKAARSLDVRGRFYDMDDEEYAFVSVAGADSYTNDDSQLFNDELDEQARRESGDDEDEE